MINAAQCPVRTCRGLFLPTKKINLTIKNHLREAWLAFSFRDFVPSPAPHNPECRGLNVPRSSPALSSTDSRPPLPFLSPSWPVSHEGYDERRVEEEAVTHVFPCKCDECIGEDACGKKLDAKTWFLHSARSRRLKPEVRA